MSEQVLAWVLFNVFVVGVLVIDAFVFHRKAHEIKMREAVLGSAIWVGLAFLFNIWIYFWKGKEPALQFLAGYLVEQSLSVDNLFVFLLIFSYFKVPHQYQHKVLFWGILGAQVMRALFIVCGVAIINQFHWVIYIFGVFLIISGVKLFAEKGKEIHPEKNIVLRLFRKMMPVTTDFENGRFLVRKGSVLYATPLLVVLVVVETTDLIFAVDSIPAILAITKDPFIVYTSNIFAILGLRAMYFALAGLMKLFEYLHYGLGAILIFVGLKMLSEEFVHVPIWATLGFIVVTLIVSVSVSVIKAKGKNGIGKS
ncbi:MAG: hypothetical protein A2787_00565 [Omnitrophica WOR_2 bacterium RIFCSPHIGHO2_01_FULL_48_9]|nr:MAG: hypothetical protein A3D10_00020 [Omnitrophica WOR_2 bacterium RIFCSPHIGHO2_02_FULL_48_11]OGX33625.1 MAG: hypothetical protein A2787_00565 [Omnitrophica WOR_2 bacterium RIFCSPHIGHO2_01_FULL_48_9]